MLNSKLSYTNCFSRLLISCFVIVISINFSTSAQEIKKFNGVYVLNDTIEGTADLNFFLKSRDTILQGDFSFKSIKEKERDDYLTFEYFGEFNKDVKVKDWYFKSKILSLDKNYSIKELKIESTATGVSNEIFAHFTDGKADRKWVAIKYEFEKSIPKDTLYSIQTHFKTGILDGAFVSNSKNLEVSGQFSEGFMDGEWIFDDGKHKEKRIFENGVLTSVKVNDVNIEFIGFDITYTKDDEDENWEDIQLDETYFEIFNRSKIEIVFSGEYLNQSELKESIKNSNSFVNNAFQSFNFIDDYSIWNNLRGSENFKLPKVKIRKLKFSKAEINQIDAIKENLKKSRQIIKTFRENEMLEIGKLNFEELNKIDLIFSIYKEKLEELKPSLELITSPAFEYLKRDELLIAYKTDIKFPETIAYSYDEEMISEPYEFPKLDKEKYNLNYLNELLKAISDDLKELNKKANNEFEKLRKQESLTENEELLIKKRETIEGLFKRETNQEFNTYHEFYSKTVNAFIENLVNDYRKLDLDRKKSEVEVVLECMDKVIEFGEEDLIDFEERVDRVDEDYTRVVFNPFLMSDITERVKERIYKAYEGILLDYVLEDLRDNFNCDSLESKKENLKILNTSMLELREIDTKDMERELRREKDKDTILSILNIELN